jgi:hypothetical protein
MKEDGRDHFFYLFHRLEGKRVTKKEKKTEEEEVGGEPISRIHTVLIILFSSNLNRKGYSL